MIETIFDAWQVAHLGSPTPLASDSQQHEDSQHQSHVAANTGTACSKTKKTRMTAKASCDCGAHVHAVKKKIMYSFLTWSSIRSQLLARVEHNNQRTAWDEIDKSQEKKKQNTRSMPRQPHPGRSGKDRCLSLFP